jgi:hypothetical protein
VKCIQYEFILMQELRMKKQSLYIGILVAILALVSTACASSTAAGTSPTVSAESATNNPGEISVEPIFQLAIGTMLLEDSQLAVGSEQAAQLLPLWQVYNNLTNSDTTAQAEIDAIEKQIKDSMLPEQMAAIQEMGINNESMRQLFESLGLEPGFGGRMGSQGTPESETGELPFQGGEGGSIPGGGMMRGEGGGGPGLGGMAPEGMPGIQGQADPSLQATRQAQMGTRQNMGLNPMLLNALVELLQGKVQTNS